MLKLLGFTRLQCLASRLLIYYTFLNGVHPTSLNGTSLNGVHPTSLNGTSLNGVHPTSLNGISLNGVHPTSLNCLSLNVKNCLSLHVKNCTSFICLPFTLTYFVMNNALTFYSTKPFSNRLIVISSLDRSKLPNRFTSFCDFHSLIEEYIHN